MDIQNFKPSLLFRNRHIQTIASPLTRNPKPIPFSKPWSITRNGVTLQGQLSSSKKNHKHLIVAFHGLGGHNEAPYILGVTSSLIEKNFSVLRMALRGGNDDSIHTYHANQIEDIDWIVDHLNSQGYKVSLIGFSLSGCMILKWLERERNIQTAFLVSPAINLDECVKRLDDKSNRIYQRYFLKKLNLLLQKKHEKHPEVFNSFMNKQTFSSIRGFDTHFTSKRSGFSSAEEYYQTSSPSKLESIVNDVCIVHAKDDPFIGHDELARIQSLKKPNLQIHLTEYGGHVGFYQGWRQGYMVDKWAAEYFQKLLEPSKV